MSMKSMSKSLLFAILGVVWLLSACSSQAEQTYAAVAPATLSPGSTIVSPGEDVILTISGDIGVKNVGGTLAFDMPTLEQLGLVEYAIADPWGGDRQVTYIGVLMSDLIKFAGVSDSATNIHMVALDDFVADVSIADIKKWPVLLATRTDGEHMSVENAGPTRIIFPINAYPEIDKELYKDLFIWNIKTMEIQ